MTTTTLRDGTMRTRPTGHHDHQTLEALFTRIRVGRNIVAAGELVRVGGIASFPTTIATSRVWAATVSHEPGIFAAGTTWVGYRCQVGQDDGARSSWTHEIEGRFCIVVADELVDVPAAEWIIRDRSGAIVERPASLDWFRQLPASQLVVLKRNNRFLSARREALADADAARNELIVDQRGLVVNVVKRYVRMVEAESAVIDRDDLMQVGLQRLLELATQRYCGPAGDRPDTAAWSKVAMREVAAAVSSEIATITGVSVEFRQLLNWMRANPEDRDAPAAEVAFRMARAAGLTRVIEQRLAADRAEAARVLDAMLADGRAVYVAHGPHAATAKALAKAHGLFVISPRSSLAEIERAQRTHGGAVASLDAPRGVGDGPTLGDAILVDQGSYESVLNQEFLSQVFEQRGISKLEAAVWISRTGVLDPGGRGDELPEIADVLGLAGRAEARAALRRARRKLEGVAADLDVAA